MFAALLVLVLVSGQALADEYKKAKITKVAVSGETTIEAVVKGKTVTRTVWPYIKMRLVDSKGKRVSATAFFEVGTVADISTSKTIVKGKEVVTKATVLPK
jgi:hypothetical protein